MYVVYPWTSLPVTYVVTNKLSIKIMMCVVEAIDESTHVASNGGGI